MVDTFLNETTISEFCVIACRLTNKYLSKTKKGNWALGDNLFFAAVFKSQTDAQKVLKNFTHPVDEPLTVLNYEGEHRRYKWMN